MPPDPLTVDQAVTADELAGWLGLTPNRVHRLARDGLIARDDQNRFALKGTVRSYIEHVRARQTGRLASNPELQAEKLRLARANAEKIELANAKARGQVVSLEEVEKAWAAILRDVRAAMLALPARVLQRLGHLTVHDVQAIDAEVRSALESAAAVKTADPAAGPSK